VWQCGFGSAGFRVLGWGDGFLAVVLKRKGVLGFVWQPFFSQGEAGVWQCGFGSAGFRVLRCGNGFLVVVLERKGDLRLVWRFSVARGEAAGGRAAGARSGLPR
jgi:hypothetical protein